MTGRRNYVWENKSQKKKKKRLVQEVDKLFALLIYNSDIPF